MFMVPSQVDLSTYIGVEGCGCPIYFNMVCTATASLDLIKRATHSALEADAITFLIIFDMVKIAPLFSFWLKFSPP